MSLKIKELNLSGFRSYDQLHLSDLGNLTIFVGPNAVGKTNIVEGIGLLTALTSFRHAMTKDIIKNGEETSKLSIEAIDDHRRLTIELVLEKNHRSYSLNGKSKKSTDLKGLIPAVSFSPDDLNLIKGANNLRRKTLDELGTQLNKNYYQIVRDFDKVIKHKNKLLKDEAPIELLETIDELLIKVGAQLSIYRGALFNKLMRHIKTLYAEITGSSEDVNGTYIFSWETDPVRKLRSGESSDRSDVSSQDNEDAQRSEGLKTSILKTSTSEIPTQEEAVSVLQASLQDLRETEMQRKRTLVGPQRDEVMVSIDGMDASTYASQGQQRSIVLAWKLAEAQLVEEMTGQLPILLLDDVMSELDEDRRNALVSYLSEDMQTFITTANIDYFSKTLLDRAQIIEVKKHNI